MLAGKLTIALTAKPHLSPSVSVTVSPCHILAMDSPPTRTTRATIDTSTLVLPYQLWITHGLVCKFNLSKSRISSLESWQKG